MKRNGKRESNPKNRRSMEKCPNTIPRWRMRWMREATSCWNWQCVPFCSIPPQVVVESLHQLECRSFRPFRLNLPQVQHCCLGLHFLDHFHCHRHCPPIHAFSVANQNYFGPTGFEFVVVAGEVFGGQLLTMDLRRKKMPMMGPGGKAGDKMWESGKNGAVQLVII